MDNILSVLIPNSNVKVKVFTCVKMTTAMPIPLKRKMRCLGLRNEYAPSAQAHNDFSIV